MNAWHSWVWRENGQDIAELISAGPEIHVTLLPNQVLTRRRIHAVLKPLLEEYGYATTRVLHARTAQHEFVKRMGFTETWRDQTFRYYMLTELPFTKAKP